MTPKIAAPDGPEKEKQHDPPPVPQQAPDMPSKPQPHPDPPATEQPKPAPTTLVAEVAQPAQVTTTAGPQKALAPTVPEPDRRGRTPSVPPSLNPLKNPRLAGQDPSGRPRARSESVASRRGRRLSRPSSGNIAQKRSGSGMPNVEQTDLELEAKAGTIFLEISDSKSEYLRIDRIPLVVKKLDLKNTTTTDEQISLMLEDEAKSMPGFLSIKEYLPIAAKVLRAEQVVLKSIIRASADTAIVFVVFGITEPAISSTVISACAKVDVASTGTLSTSEFRQVLKALDFGLTVPDASSLMRTTNPDGEGMIDYRLWTQQSFRSLAPILVGKVHRLLAREHDLHATLTKAISKISVPVTIENMRPILCNDDPFKLVPEEVSVIFELYRTASGKPLDVPLDLQVFLPIAVRQLLILLAEQSESQFAAFLNSRCRGSHVSMFERSRVVKAIEAALTAKDSDSSGQLDRPVAFQCLVELLSNPENKGPKLSEMDVGTLTSRACRDSGGRVDIRIFAASCYRNMVAMALEKTGPVMPSDLPPSCSSPSRTPPL